MKIISRIKRQLFRGYFRIGAVIHVRHWRGHGIHSPFMYGICLLYTSMRTDRWNKNGDRSDPEVIHTKIPGSVEPGIFS